jgi:hypothetical protein
MKKPQKPVHRGTSGAAKGGGGKGGGRHRTGGGAGVVAGGGSAAPVARKGPGKGKGGAKPKHHRHHHPKRKLSAGDVACCSAEALAASLRLAGHPVTDEDVLELYWLTASDPDEGASILATLEAAQRFGLAGIRPAEVHEGNVADERIGAQQHPELHPLHLSELELLDDSAVALLDRHEPFALGGLDGDGGDAGRRDPALVFVHPLIVGVTLPGGPHALTVDPSGAVWSWGELHDPGELLPGPIEEAWEVRW